MTAVMTGHAPIGADTLSRAESLQLADYEQIIERGKKTFIEVGMALAAIHEHRLYRTQYGTFEEYCAARWDFTGRRGLQLIEAAAIGNIFPVANSQQANELAKVPEEQRADVWREASETEGKVTAEKIRDAADTRKPDLAPVILDALTEGGREGLDFKAIAVCFAEPPADKDLTRALEKLVKAGEIVVTRTWANGKPRKWASAALVGDITPDVERVLADAGPDGRTAWQIAFLLAPGQPGPEVAALAVHVAPILERLAAGGKARCWDAEGGMRWALPEVARNETPGPVAADAPAVVAGSGSTFPEPEPETCLGTDMDCGRSLPCPDHPRTPAERIAAVAEVAPEFVKPAPASAEADRIRLVGEARRKAQRLVPLVASAINEIEIGIAYGESGLATAEMVAGLRAQADRLEQYVKEKKA